MNHRKPLAIIALAFIGACGVGATDDPTAEGHDCSDAICVCEQDVCLLDCEDLSQCSAQCEQASECTIRCQGDDCYPSCGASTSCDIECGDACQAQCGSSESCVVKVGQLSQVECGEAGCTVQCEGDCTVECPSNSCFVTCWDGPLATQGPGTLGCVSD